MARFTTLRQIVLSAALVALLPWSATGNPGQTAVTGTWRGAPATAAVGTEFELVLHLEAADDAPVVTAELVPSAGIEFLTANSTWRGALLRGRSIDLPLTVRVVQDGNWTIGSRITIYRPEGNQVAGAVLSVVAANGSATLSRDSHDAIKIAAIATAEDALALGIAMPDPGTPRPDLTGTAVASTVSGTARYRDLEGNFHPVRRALVQITNASGGLLANAATNDAGQYSVAINADSVRATVFTQDPADTVVAVFPPGQTSNRYFLQSALTPITAAATPINLDGPAVVRGTPGAPSTDQIGARAFAVYDGMMAFWLHASTMIGRNMQRALTNYPNTAQCPTSCYSPSTQQMYIHREDAFDWDVLGHEFFHFVTNRAAARVIDTNPGGFHSFGSAIGQNNGSGHIRTRDEGMRLAWAEGVATVMSLMIQRNPPAAFPFPALANVNDANYHDTENTNLNVAMETPVPSDGFGSENSVSGVLWDLADTAQDSDGTITDNFAGLNASLLWAAMNSLLPCNPCDRVDKFWNGLVDFLGIINPTMLEIGKLFALNKSAAIALTPADGASVPGTAAPTFTWSRNGDPAAGHRNNQFYLVFSRDNFASHRAVIPVPTLDVASYTPTDAEWLSVQAGSRGGETYRWFVAAKRSDAPTVPGNWFWYSNVRTLAPRSIEATITWAPLGADVDLHLANPSGTDIAYYNTNTGWGFLDRDCITTCTQEIISISGLPLRGAYRLFVHYFSDRGRGPATVRAVVRSGSQVLVDTVFTLSGTGATRTLVSFSTDETESGAREVVVDTALDPAALPPKSKSP